jgi:hypothetical protein
MELFAAWPVAGALTKAINIRTGRATRYKNADTNMKLRFKVNQAEAFRRGFDAPKSVATIEVNPADLPADEREMIAERIENGIDVIELDIKGVKKTDSWSTIPNYIEAPTPTYEGLIAAVRGNERIVITRPSKAANV